MHPLLLQREATSISVAQYYEQKELSDQFTKEFQTVQRRLDSKLKRNEKFLEAKRQELSNSKKWTEIQHEGQLIQANLFRISKGMAQVEVDDWLTDTKKMILLDPLKTPSEQSEALFRKSQKMRKSEPYLINQLSQLEEERKKIKQELEKLSLCTTFKELKENFKTEPPQKIPQTPSKRFLPKKPYKEYLSAAKLPIWVGKSARDNEILTFSYANGSDWWLHVNDFPGSHIVIKVAKGQEPDQESLQDALQLALNYSKAKAEGAADIIITQCKFISRFGKGHVGKVHVSKHKTQYVKCDKKRLEALKLRAPKT